MFEKTRSLALRASIVTASALAPVIAFAEGGGGGNDPTATFTEKAGELGTAVALYGAGLVVLTAVGVGFMVAMKYVKKLRGAA